MGLPLGSAGSMGGPFATGGGGGSPFATSGGLQSLDVVLVISRLLDMPIETTMLGRAMNYRIRVYNDAQREIGPLIEIAGSTPPGQDMETIAVPPSKGTIRLKSHVSQLLYVEVELVGGLLGGTSVGTCQIHRLDPRSSQVWPYALSTKSGEGANCGVELKIVEEGVPPPFAGSAAQFSMGAPLSGAPFGGRPSAMLPSAPGSSLSMPGKRNDHQVPHLTHGVSALLEFDKVQDVPYPRAKQLKEVELVVLSDETHKELRRIGPFAAMDQGANKAVGGRLARANCAGSSVFVQEPIHFGGASEEGAIYLRISVSFGNSAKRHIAPELIGITNPIKVSWVPTQISYYPLLSREGQTLGGVYLRHRLLTEQEAAAQPHNEGLTGAFEPHHKSRWMPQIGGPIEPMHRVSGRTGTFPAGSVEEAYEQASINAEAQNRALLQLCKRADPNRHENDPHVSTVNGYREWDSLDSLFATMGPNPLAMSEEVGPAVTRSYKEKHSIMAELKGKLPTALSPADERLNLEMLRMMTHEDPTKVSTALRPVVCKDPDEIVASKDMSWCPDPPVYAPIRNLRDEDKETLRLACYAPEMDSQLSFVDANPNYRVDEDIWGVLADYKTAESLVVPKHPGQHKRVKDDCIMA